MYCTVSYYFLLFINLVLRVFFNFFFYSPKFCICSLIYSTIKPDDITINKRSIQVNILPERWSTGVVHD